MNVTEQLAQKINSMTYLPTELKIAHLSPKVTFGIYAQPGAQIISEDFSGLQERAIPHEIILKTDDYELADNTLMRISELLDNMTSLETDGTYVFESIEITPAPFLVTIDIDEKGIYVLDFTVTIEQQTNKKQEN